MPRHKLTGKLTPVTEETFNAWKAQRLSKKEAEEQARLAKEATGRMLFEKGDWRADLSDDDSEAEDDGGGGDDTGFFDLEELRRQTFAAEVEVEGSVKVWGR